jgi:alpha/beta superfamily hydrolase
MEEQVSFQSDNMCIDGLFEHNGGSKAVVITHPHSLYGGDMQNSVVSIIQQAFSKKGYSTLRFNFRGVGRSEGNFDNGIGEQNDLQAAVDYLLTNGFETVDLAGYSFGSWVGASLAYRLDLFKNVILVSPPVSFMDFSDILHLPSLRLTIVGDTDDFCELEALKKRLSILNSEAALEIISNTDHFYTGRLDLLSAVIEDGI